MISALSSLFGDDGSPYDANKFSIYGNSSPHGSGSPPGPLPPVPSPPGPPPGPEPGPLPAPRRLPTPLVEDEGQQSGGLGSPEPSQFGCWILPQFAKVPTGGNQQIVWDRSATAAKTQIAALEAPTGFGSTLAAYDDRTWRTPFEVSQDVVVTGSLINTYTGEVSETYENAIAPPDRAGGDPEREWKNSSLRLQAAQGYEPRKLQKREIEDPLPPADSGPILENASFRQMQAVTLEGNERCARDKYFNCNELVPTEPMMTTNPMGYRGFQNMMRINPYLPVTQELDTKDWTSNATSIPTTARFLETRIRLHRDALAGRTGLAEGPFDEEHIRPQVRVADTQRNTECKQGPRNKTYNISASTAASAESVAKTLRGISGVAQQNTRGGSYSGQRPDVSTADRMRAHRPQTGMTGSRGPLNLEVAPTTLAAFETDGPAKPERTYGDANRSSLSMEAHSAFASAEVQATKKRESAPRRTRFEGSIITAAKPLVASAEECRRTLLPTGTDVRTAAPFVAGAMPIACSLEDPHKQDSVISQAARHAQTEQLLGATLSVSEVTGIPTKRGDGTAGDNRGRRLDTGLVNAQGAPEGAKTLSDLRGLIPNERHPGFEHVTEHQVRRPMAAERPERDPELIISHTGKPNNIVSERAFVGTQSRKERVRGPTPRKGGAERMRSGLARLDGPSSYADE